MTFNWRSYINALSAKFNERIARHYVCHRKLFVARLAKCRCHSRWVGRHIRAVLPPNIGHEAGSAGRRIVSFFEALRHI